MESFHGENGMAQQVTGGSLGAYETRKELSVTTLKTQRLFSPGFLALISKRP